VLTLFSSWSELVGAALVLGFAQGVYVLFGFGAGLIAVGAMAVFLPSVTDVVVLLLLVSLPAELFVVTRSLKLLRWRALVLIAAGLALGILLGTRILTVTEPRIVLTMLAGLLILFGVVFLVLRAPRCLTWPGWTQPVVGLVSGILAGLFGTGGPPLILYYQSSGADKSTFRVSLMALFLLTGLVRLPAYALSGLITTPRLLAAAALLPAALLGGFIGHRVHIEVAEVTFRRLVSVALCLIGLLLLLR
jgi:uncharacterized membrane protein YfcA